MANESEVRLLQLIQRTVDLCLGRRGWNQNPLSIKGSLREVSVSENDRFLIRIV